MSDFLAFQLSPPRLRFRDAISTERVQGISRYHPHRQPAIASPVFAFVFPDEYRNEANQLYLALRNGIGPFKGLRSMFNVPLEPDNVLKISGFSLAPNERSSAQAEKYKRALESHKADNREVPDLAFVIHPKTSRHESDTPYYESKAALLKEGVVSQSVTVETIRDSYQLKWSAGNIALAAFAKLGGIPWLVEVPSGVKDYILGVGIARLYSESGGDSEPYMGFTSCISGDGEFKFSRLSDVAYGRHQYKEVLRGLVRESLDVARKSPNGSGRLIVCIDKDLRNDEGAVVNQEAENAAQSGFAGKVYVLRVDGNSIYHAYDASDENGNPSSGLAVRVADNQYVVYQEGRDEKRSWIGRLPASFSCRMQTVGVTESELRSVIESIYRTSQMNWRGFNAESTPISVSYARWIASIIGHISPKSGKLLKEQIVSASIADKPWFL